MNSKEVLTVFLSDMLSWENQRSKKLKIDQYKNNIDGFRVNEDEVDRNHLTHILIQYLTEKAFEHFGPPTITGMAVGRPPIYDQAIIDEGSTRLTHTYICISNNGALLGAILKYSLVKEDGAWKIDNLHTKSSDPSVTTWKRRAAF